MITADTETDTSMAIVRRAAQLGYDPWRVALALNLDPNLAQAAIDSAGVNPVQPREQRVGT